MCSTLAFQKSQRERFKKQKNSLSYRIAHWLFDVSERLSVGEYLFKHKNWDFSKIEALKRQTQSPANAKVFYSRRAATTLIYVKPCPLDFNANCRCLCFDLFSKFTQNSLWWNSTQPISNSLRRWKLYQTQGLVGWMLLSISQYFEKPNYFPIS